MSIIPNNTIIVPVNTAATTNEITLSADFCFFIPIIARTIPTKVTAIIDSNNASEDVGLIHSSIRNPQTSPSRNNAKVLNRRYGSERGPGLFRTLQFIECDSGTNEL